MKHEPPIFLFMQNYSYTRLATANHRRPSPMFPERKGWGGEGGGGGVSSRASVLAILWTYLSFAVNVMLAISIPVVVFLKDVKLLVIFNEGHLAWTSLLHVSSEK